MTSDSPMTSTTKPNRNRKIPCILLLPLLLLPFSLYHFHYPYHRTFTIHTPPPISVKCLPTKLPPLQPPPTPHPKLHPLIHKSFFSNYVRFHNFHRNCYKIFGPRFPCANTLIWTCPLRRCAGAGDRIRGIQFAFMYAVVTNRVFFIDWTYPVALEAALVPAAIDWTLPHFVRDKLKKGVRVPNLDVPRLAWFQSMGSRTGYEGRAFTANITQLMVNVTRANYNQKNAGGESIDFLKDDVLHVAEHEHILAIESRLFPRLSYFLLNPYIRKALWRDDSERLRNEIANQTVELHFRQMLTKTLFAPSPKLQHILDRRKAQLQGPYDAVHARLGADVGETRGRRFREANSHQNATAQALLRCLAVASEGNRTERVFLGTDSAGFKSVFAKAAKTVGVSVGVNEKKAKHLNGAWGGEHACEDYRELFADAYMLGGARRLVGTRSGFGDMAAGMGDVQAFVDTLLLEGNRCDWKWGKVELDGEGIRRKGGRRRR